MEKMETDLVEGAFTAASTRGRALLKQIRQNRTVPLILEGEIRR
jgi:hypothetical protein